MGKIILPLARLMTILLFLFSSCATQLMPSGSFVPQMQEKKDLKAKVSLSTNSFQTAVAYAPFNHFALKTDAGISYNYLTGIPENRSSEWDITEWFFDIPMLYQNSYFEISTGYFNKFKDLFIYEIYSGIKIGFYKDTEDKGNYYNPNINFAISHIGSKFSYGISAKMIYNIYNVPRYYSYHDIYYIYKFRFFSFEPDIFLKLGKRNLLAEFQIGTMLLNNNKTFILHETNYGELIDHSKLYISVGLSYNFNHKTKKQ